MNAQFLRIYFGAVKVVFKHAGYFAGFIIFALGVLGLFLYIPIRSIPGNDLQFQLSLLRPADIALLVTLAGLTSMSAVMNMYALRNKPSIGVSVTAVSQGSIGGIGGILASVFGTATCASCVASLFGFLGVSGVFFLLDYRWIITSIAIIVMIVSLYFTSRKVLHICEECNNLKPRRKK